MTTLEKLQEEARKKFEKKFPLDTKFWEKLATRVIKLRKFRHKLISSPYLIRKMIEGMKVKSHSISWSCSKCRSYGNEGKYCENDKTKLVKESFEYENQEDKKYNQALSDILEKI